MLVSQLVEIGAVSAIVSFGLCALIVYSQKWHGRLSHDHDLGGVQKVHATAVPRIGGLAVITAIFFALCLVGLTNPVEINPSHVHRILLLLCAALPAFIAGIAEDISKKVSARTRLTATICSSLLASAFLDATISELDIWGIDSLLTLAPVGIVVTAVVVAGGTNATNIIDGFNGLSGSVIAIMSAALGALAWHVGDAFVAILSALAIGASIGFLFLNFPAGKLFLGDGGAYFLGFWVAETAVLLLVRNPVINAWQVLSICAYPVIEVLFSVYRRKFVMNGNPGAADALHLHTLLYHRIIKKRFSDWRGRPWVLNAAVTFMLAPFILILAIASLLLGDSSVGGVFIVIAQVVIYLSVYSRLVRGRWKPIRREPAAPVVEAANP